MKKFLLSFFMCMLAIIGMQAEEVTISVDFSKYTGNSTQYAKETHKLHDDLEITIEHCHINTQLRIYSSNTNNGYVVSNELPGAITNMTFNAGYKADALNVYGSTNGSEWTLVGEVSTSTSYKDYSLVFTGDYTFFKLDVKGTQQIRVAQMSVTYETSGEQPGEGGGEDPETPVERPEEPAMPCTGWALVKDASTLAVGDKVVIAATESDVALSTTQNSNNRGQATVTKNGETITFGNDVQELTLEAGTVDNTWAFNTGSGYLYAASSSSNHLKTNETLTANGSWAITITDGATSVVAQGSNTRNELKYNQSSSLFSCYASGNTQKAISLYRYVEPIEANIAYGMYYLSPGAWDETATWYAAKFVNANTGVFEWVYGVRKEAEDNVGVYYYLGDEANNYTHIIFCAMVGEAPVFNEESGMVEDLEGTIAKMTWENVIATSGYLTYTPAQAGFVRVYFVDEAAWNDVNPETATGVNRVELAEGIGYAYGVVSAEGAIEVYNVNGAVVARGNDNVDLRGLGRGVYIIRNGNQVRKVVR